MKPIQQSRRCANSSHQIVCASQPLFSIQNQDWEQILVEEFHHPAGEGKMLYPTPCDLFVTGSPSGAVAVNSERQVLLKQTDRSVMKIALDCGFNSNSHLSKQFRQFTGLTPKAYRAN